MKFSCPLSSPALGRRTLAALACIALTCFAAPALAQTPARPTAKPDYTGESAIIESLSRIYTYAADGTGSRDITQVVEVRNQAAVKTLSILTYITPYPLLPASPILHHRNAQRPESGVH